jgi:hypothetical protein
VRGWAWSRKRAIGLGESFNYIFDRGHNFDIFWDLRIEQILEIFSGSGVDPCEAEGWDRLVEAWQRLWEWSPWLGPGSGPLIFNFIIFELSFLISSLFI